jgi:hypothetical protein
MTIFEAVVIAMLILYVAFVGFRKLLHKARVDRFLSGFPVEPIAPGSHVKTAEIAPAQVTTYQSPC